MATYVSEIYCLNKQEREKKKQEDVRNFNKQHSKRFHTFFFFSLL